MWLMCAIHAPAFDGEFNIMTLKAFSKRLLQNVLQFLVQLCLPFACLVRAMSGVAAVKAENLCATRAFEMTVLVLCRMGGRTMLGMFIPRAVTEHSVIARDFVRQTGIR